MHDTFTSLHDNNLHLADHVKTAVHITRLGGTNPLEHSTGIPLICLVAEQ